MLPYLLRYPLLMESNNKLKGIDIKNCTCYYFDDKININDIDLNNILLDEKSYENILIDDVAYRSSYAGNILCIFSIKWENIF